MFEYFDKNSLFFLSDNTLKNKNKIDYKNLLKYDFLSNFSCLFNLLIYYIDLNHCNNIVLLYFKDSVVDKIKEFFPQINFYLDYENDIQNLKIKDKNFCLVFNNTKEDLKFCKVLIEKYDPYVAMLNYYFDVNYKNYLGGLLLKDYFSIEERGKLIIRGVGYRDWHTHNLKENWIEFQKCREYKKYINPITNDNTTIYKERGLYNGMDETYLTILVLDYLKKTNSKINYSNTIKIILKILDNKNLDIIRLID